MYEKIDKNNYTPMMQQYLEIKENYSDSLVFFRLGDFYELFFNDAIVASKELEIVLTGKDAGAAERVPMCGMPHHSANGYIEKLTQKGYKVAIVEQLEQPGLSKIVKRGVIKVVTPGTNIDEMYLDNKDNNYIGSVEYTDSKFVFAYIDISTGETNVTTYETIDFIYSEITKLNIKEVVVSSKFSKTYVQILSKVYGVLVSLNDNIIDDYLSKLTDDLDKTLVSACKRLLSYILETQKRVLMHLLPFKYYSNKDFLRMDNSCVRSLELVESNKGNKYKNNLLVAIDRCKTAMGSRMLKKNLLFPLINQQEILNRQRVIDVFNKKYFENEEILKLLSEIYDLERIIGRISYGVLSPKDLLQLRRSLTVIPKIKEILLSINDLVINQIGNNIDECFDLINLLESSINDEVPNLLCDGGVIKTGFNKELDSIRQMCDNNKDYIINLELSERQKTGIKTLKVGFNKVFGYFIEVTKANIPNIKPEFGYIRKQTRINSERYITDELKERENLILRSDERCLELEIEIFNKIRDNCKEYAKKLQNTAKIISEIDMMLSFRKISEEFNLVKPIFSAYNEIDIKEGRHIVLEMLSDELFIPNDITMSATDNVLLITGPNMSGKSTFMRQTALIIILAQCGSFVPAKAAKLPIVDAIFTRIGSSDDITNGESTFMNEMKEVNNALKNATSNSLILFDEVGRGTATFDGMAIAQAIIEHITNDLNAKTLFSTHYHELTTLDESLYGVKNVHVEAAVNNDEIVFLHKVIDGPSHDSYGVNVATLAGLPKDITLRANNILSIIEKNHNYDSKELSIHNYQKPIIIKEEVNPVYKEIVNIIEAQDIESTRPIDALLVLTQLKEYLKK